MGVQRKHIHGPRLRADPHLRLDRIVRPHNRAHSMAEIERVKKKLVLTLGGRCERGGDFGFVFPSFGEDLFFV